MNLITNDCQRLFEAAIFFHFIWATVIFATVITVILAIEFQWATIPGMVMFILFFVLQYRTGRMVSSIRAKAIKLTDQRVSLMSEILSAMKLVKLYAWESSFASQVAKIRKAGSLWFSFFSSRNLSTSETSTHQSRQSRVGLHSSVDRCLLHLWDLCFVRQQFKRLECFHDR